MNVKTGIVVAAVVLILYIVYKINFGNSKKAEKERARKEKQKEKLKKKQKADVGGIIFTLILGILYIPFSMFSTFGIMLFNDVSVENIPYSNVIMSIFTYMPIICLISIISALIFRIKHRSILAAFTQLLPMMIFICSIAVMIWLN